MPGLRLLNLPGLPLKEVIELMDFDEKAKLAICSKKCGGAVRMTKCEVGYFELKYGSTRCDIIFKKSPQVDLFDISLIQDNYHSPIKTYAFWFNNRVERESRRMKTDHIDFCLDLSKRFRSAFIIKYCQYTLKVEDYEGRSLERLLDRVLVDDYDKVRIEGRYEMTGQVVSSDAALTIMQKVKSDAFLEMVPRFFLGRQHKPFKFKSVLYYNGDSLKLSHLKSIRNVDKVLIESSFIKTKEYNKFLHHWVECKTDMMKEFRISLHPHHNMNLNVIFDKLDFVEKAKPENHDDQNENDENDDHDDRVEDVEDDEDDDDQHHGFVHPAFRVVPHHHLHRRPAHSDHPIRYIKARFDKNRRLSIGQITILNHQHIVELKTFEPVEMDQLLLRKLEEKETQSALVNELNAVKTEIKEKQDVIKNGSTRQVIIKRAQKELEALKERKLQIETEMKEVQQEFDRREPNHEWV